jgi:N-methylhydantoinase B
MQAAAVTLDPIKYEVFVHRLWAIGEEGRIALQRVSASPIVVQGGECMSSFYAPDGTMILACSGHLRFAAATSDAIKKLVEWFGERPGFYEGDQIFFNDPYVAGSHTYDQMVVMPIYADGELIAWTASSSHTADTGGLLRGVATEIYHEGIRVLGVKVVERGEFRDDVFKTIVEQCRDPDYVGLDLKSRIAANNVCARRFQQLVATLGKDFVVAAGQKIVEDSERLAREKLRSIPDGTWSSRLYSTAPARGTREAQPYPVVCTMTKRGDTLEIDCSGSGPQLENDQNSTLPSTLAHIALALTNQLFWDIPWSDGKMRPVHVTVPEGSILHCRFPAACGGAPRVGQILVAAVSDCLAKMLYAAGRHDDVNATWAGFWYLGGPGWFYGGHHRDGLPVPQGLYDTHGGGLGATPARDGVNTGGHPNIPSGGISDVERIEMQYPFLYFSRNHQTDGGGYGKYQGGAGSQRVLMAYGSPDLSVDFRPYGGIPQGAFGLFGGYPAGAGGLRALLEPAERQAASGGQLPTAYPTDPDAALVQGATVSLPPGNPPRIAVPPGWLITDFTQGGGGYGDPLERPAARVAVDVQRGLVSPRTARLVYGVVLGHDGAPDEAATTAARAAIRDDRQSESRPPEPGPRVDGAALRPGLRVHECLELASGSQGTFLRCRRCGHVLCDAHENYKHFALRRARPMEELSGRPLPSNESYLGVLHEYACPGCATLLQVDAYCLAVGGDEDWWDLRVTGGAD